VSPSDLIGWDEPDYRASQAFGDRWYDQRRSAVLVVPSVLSPFEPNILINQDHNEFPRIAIGPESPVLLDHRLVAR
jgi:RES domain-containing protein